MKRILVTGGGGSVGLALVRKLLQRRAGTIRVLDTNEDGLFRIKQELPDAGDHLRLFIGDIRDPERVLRAMEGVDSVFHCAGLKHVDFSEYDPFEATQTNVIGTQNIIAAALKQNVRKVLFTSSDKAVNPTSTMGATKLLAERLFIAANHHLGARRTRFACVRFGNVTNSNGSVTQIFQRQLATNRPLTITSTKMTRFFLPMPHAVDLVLSSIERMVGGEIFVQKMGSCGILAIAKAICGERPLRVKEIGLKPGEKLYEELVTEEEVPRTIELPNMYVILPTTMNAKIMPHFIRKAYDVYRKEGKPLVAPVRSDTLLMTKPHVSEMLRSSGVL